MIENNSTDGSLKIAERYARAHKNIRLIVQDGGKMGGARNTGIRAASGKYITFLDSDDYFNYGALKDAASTLSTNHVDLLMYNFDKVHFSTGQKLSYKETSFGYDEVLNSKSYSPFDAIGKIGMVTVSRMIYKRDLLIKNQLFFRSNMNHEDVLYFIKMFSHDLSFYTRNKSFFSYRVMRPNSVMSTGGHVSDVFTLVDVLRKDFRSRNLLKQHNVDLLNLENKLLKGAFRGLSIEESMSLLRYMKERYNSEEHLEKYGDADLTSMRYYAQYSALKKGGFWYWLRKIGPNQLEFEVKRFAFGLL